MTGGDHPRGHRLDPDARREQILAAAARVYGTRPYADVSSTEIADAAGVARGLVNHYFGTKRELYLAVVRRLVLNRRVPATTSSSGAPVAPVGSLRERVARAVDWYLDSVSARKPAYLATLAGVGIATDADVEAILTEADTFSAHATLESVGIPPAEHEPLDLVALRSYVVMGKATVRAWLRDGTLNRQQAHLLLSETLYAMLTKVRPELARYSS